LPRNIKKKRFQKFEWPGKKKNRAPCPWPKNLKNLWKNSSLSSWEKIFFFLFEKNLIFLGGGGGGKPPPPFFSPFFFKTLFFFLKPPTQKTPKKRPHQKKEAPFSLKTP
jgi:hypothetical protein